MSVHRIYSLNVHADYACRHRHACCTAGWSIPVEPDRVALLGGAWLLPSDDGACQELDREAGRCRVHRVHGERSLPDSCHHFPRRSLLDERGTFVSLSHFCPTAATLLLDTEGPLSIVEAPPAFPPERGYEGLDAREEWPPLLRRDALFDLDSFTRWEQYVVATCGAPVAGVDATLITIASAAEQLRAWRVDRGPLAEWTTSVLQDPARLATHGLAPVTAEHAALVRRYARVSGPEAYRAVCASVPTGLSAPDLPSSAPDVDAQWVAPYWTAMAPAVLRYVGARAFASWTPYQSRGIRTQVAELFAAASVLRVECVRECLREQRPLDRAILHEAVRWSDWLLVHLADRNTFMDWLGQVEDDHL